MQIRLHLNGYNGYSDEDLEDFLSRLNDHVEILTQRIVELESFADRVKHIVPLVDEDLGMHPSSN
jgi:hypothetical protein